MTDKDKTGEMLTENRYESLHEDWRPLIRFTGAGSAYFGLLFKTFIFSLLTLGIYSFWGRTIQRQYLWGNTLLLDEPLEYTGIGKELFISFLIVVPVFLVLVLAFSFATAALGPLGWIGLYFPLVFLWQFATYRALRFRLTRTRWRGIRGNMGGSAILYGVMAAGYLFLAIISLGLLYPWASGKMADYILNNAWFGNRKLAFSGSIRRLYKTYLLGLMGGLIATTLLFGLAYSLLSANLGNLSAFSRIAAIVFFIFLIFSVCSAFYRAAFFRWLFEQADFGHMRTRSTLSGERMLYLTLTNFALIACTLGLGTAWAVIRAARTRLNSILYQGDPHLDELLQDTKKAPKSGEGLLDALDVNISL
jgi:uncharacterized membrane protein YjgN (DUF898 family)